MPKPAKGQRLGAGPSHEKLMLGGLAAALFREERIRTTQAKAKRLRPVAERLITWGKAGTVHARRQVLSVIDDRDIVHKLFAEISPRYVDRNGGYTRILKLGPRKGDAAPMAVIELVEGEAPPTSTRTATEEEPARRRRGIRRRGREGRPETPVLPSEAGGGGEEAEELTEEEAAEEAAAEAEAADELEAEATEVVEAEQAADEAAAKQSATEAGEPETQSEASTESDEDKS